jgi:hypothetical protein
MMLRSYNETSLTDAAGGRPLILENCGASSETNPVHEAEVSGQVFLPAPPVAIQRPTLRHSAFIRYIGVR